MRWNVGLDAITPHPPGVDPDDELIHERAYVVRAYRQGDDRLVLRGAVRDQKPPGLYVPDDPEPLTVHHMILDLTIEVPSLVIVDANLAMEMHPHTNCVSIEQHYKHLIGLSIARGFTHKVRELFGGPRGCTHSTALLQAMAPVAIQSMWSFRIAKARETGVDPTMSVEQRRQLAVMTNLNTCHIWAEDGAQVAALMAGEPMEVPVWIIKRMKELGRDEAAWTGWSSEE
jgi:Protein of unknown function (DUF2889)